jgi:hypothetical protein
LICVIFPPQKAQSPSIVDANAVLPGTITFQGLQSVAWCSGQVTERPSSVQQKKFSPCDSFKRAQGGDVVIVKQGFRRFISE